MVMEKGDTDLHKVLQMYKTDIPLYKLIRHWYEMLLAVDFIHQRGVIHSDLKPANFLIVNGHLKLIDFGIASNINLDATSIVKNCQAGTFNYISPEAVTDTSEDNSSQVPKIKVSMIARFIETCGDYGRLILCVYSDLHQVRRLVIRLHLVSVDIQANPFCPHKESHVQSGRHCRCQD